MTKSQTATITRQQIEDARALVSQGSATLAGKLALEICDLALSVLPRETATNTHVVTKEHIDAFRGRYSRDKAADMSNDKWGEWVDALPQVEFLAMVQLGVER